MAGQYHFPFFYQRFLASTMGWTPEERWHYIALLCVQFDSGGIDPDRLEACSPGVSKCWPLIRSKFQTGEDGLLRNPMMERTCRKIEGHRKRGRGEKVGSAPSPSDSPIPKTEDNRTINHKPVRGRRKSAEKSAETAQKERRNGADIPQVLSSPAFTLAWDAWKEHRRDLRSPLTPLTVEKQLSMLAGLGEAEAIRTIERSITAGWVGLFPEGKEGRGAGPRKATPQADKGEFNGSIKIPVIENGAKSFIEYNY